MGSVMLQLGVCAPVCTSMCLQDSTTLAQLQHTSSLHSPSASAWPPPLTRILTNFWPSEPVVTSTESIMPLSLCRSAVDASCQGAGR